MNWSPITTASASLLLLLTPLAGAQQQPSTPAPVPYSSVSQLNLLLAQIEQASQSSQVDLAKLRIEKWKTDSSTRQQSQANVESLARNMQSALPEMIGQLRTSPEDLSATFKLYRNLDALYDVFGSVVESAGAFGSKDDFQALENDLNALERTRRSLAERMETLSASKEAELNHLRTEVKTLQATATPVAPKKVVVDDTEPPKKARSSKKKAPQPASTPPQ